MTIPQINARFKHCLAISPYAIFIPASEGSELCANRQCPNSERCRYFTDTLPETEDGVEKECTIMYHKDGNPGICRHSKGRSVTGLDKNTLAVYSTCKHSDKQSIGKQYYLSSVVSCENCDKCKSR